MQNVDERGTNFRLNTLLNEFNYVFIPISSLPLVRSQDHAIYLKHDTLPLNVRPYRYSYYQKNEIESLVGEMLKFGIFKPSTSPFSNLVLLVKNKDKGWQFCVDYQALNKIIILDKFPIPAIEELLDELGGATVFSKID